jgi:hypothetical protein
MDERKVKAPSSEPQSAADPLSERQPEPAKQPAPPTRPEAQAPSPTEPTAPPSQTQPEAQSAPQSQTKVGVAEREPLSLVVVDAPAAEPEVEPETQVEVPVEVPTKPRPTIAEPTEAPRVPYLYWALVALALGLVLHTYRYIFEPLVVRVEDSVERRVLGDKIIEAPKSNPHTTRQKEPRFRF